MTVLIILDILGTYMYYLSIVVSNGRTEPGF